MAVTEAAPAAARERSYEELERIFAGTTAPFAFVDLDAMWSNAREMLGRAGGVPIRVASKSVRCRSLLSSILELDPGFRGLMTFTLPETLWLHGHGFGDLLVGLPERRPRRARRALARLEDERPPIVMVDSVEQLDLIESAARGAGRVRVCIDLDLSWWPLGGRLKIGVKRSPVHDPVAGARARGGDRAAAGPRAGRADGLRGPRRGRRRPAARQAPAELRDSRRQGAVDARAGRAPRRRRGRRARGGRRSSSSTAAGPAASTRRAEESVVTEITAGSGFYAPTLFDRYASFRLTPAAMFALPVVRRPERRSGHAAGRRLPRIRRAPAGIACPRPSCRAGCGSTRSKGPARCRRRS